MILEKEIRCVISKAVINLYNFPIQETSIVLQETRKDFEGDITIVTFGLSKMAGKSPEETGKDIGNWILGNTPYVFAFNQVKGFLNLSLKNEYFISEFQKLCNTDLSEISIQSNNKFPVIVEYSSPNTNKPLHLGHVRNNLIGSSLCRILEAAGHTVIKSCIVNDRGIHICKSMLAWMKFGNGETPESTGIKGDHLVGKYYVLFDKEYKKQIEDLVLTGLSKEDAERKAPIIIEAQEMLLKWEIGETEVVDLWKKMNGWVYKGFEVTYNKLGVSFDKIDYESETYLLGKSIVEKGLSNGVFIKRDDGSVWVDLTDEGLDMKLVLRKDGTSVYITQDIGTAYQRFEQTQFSKMIYVVGNEQEYHFKVLKAILKKLGFEWWNRLHHMSYNMVDLPSGKMKSREGTVVDADDLISQTISDAEKMTRELGKLVSFDDEYAIWLYETIGMGALKFFILKVDPEKRMLFNPEESIDINGFTGPFIQYTYARTQSVIRKGRSINSFNHFESYILEQTIMESELLFSKEKTLLKLLLEFNNVVMDSVEKLSPALIANYAYELAKTFNQFYQECVIVDENNVKATVFRLKLTQATANTLVKTLTLIGINLPPRM